MAKDQTDLLALALQHGKIALRHMGEGGGVVLMRLGQGQPGLQAEHRERRATGLAIGALGVGDAVPGQHPVHRAGFDPLVGAQAVAVMQAAFQEIGHSAEADMGMGTHVDASAGQELGGPIWSKKMKGPTI